jgi:hypothetical protein
MRDDVPSFDFPLFPSRFPPSPKPRRAQFLSGTDYCIIAACYLFIAYLSGLLLATGCRDDCPEMEAGQRVCRTQRIADGMAIVDRMGMRWDRIA